MHIDLDCRDAFPNTVRVERRHVRTRRLIIMSSQTHKQAFQFISSMFVVNRQLLIERMPWFCTRDEGDGYDAGIGRKTPGGGPRRAFLHKKFRGNTAWTRETLLAAHEEYKRIKAEFEHCWRQGPLVRKHTVQEVQALRLPDCS